MSKNFHQKLDDITQSKNTDTQSADLNNEEKELLESAEIIIKSKVKDIPDANDFQNKLFSRIKKERTQIIKEVVPDQPKAWDRFFAYITNIGRIKKWAPVVAGFVLIAMVASLFYWLPGGDKMPGIRIQTAMAQESFKLKATSMDKAGIDNDTDFVLESKQTVKAAEVKQNLSFEPEIKFEAIQKSANEILIDVEEDLETNRIYQAVLQAVAVDNGREYDNDFAWAYQVKNDFKVINTLPRDKTNNIPLDTGIEINFSHENFTDYEQYFSIEPAVNGYFEKHYQTLVFVPENLDYLTIYTVTIKAGMPLSDSDLTLKEDFVFQFETTYETGEGSKNGFVFADQLVQFAQSDRKILALNIVRYGEEKDADFKLPTKVYRFDNNESFLEYIRSEANHPTWSWYYQDMSNYPTENLELVGEYDLEIYSQSYNNFVSFAELPSELAAGQYLVEGTNDGQTNQVAVEVTDISAFTKITKSNIFAWVWDVATGQPLSDANVKTVDGAVLGTTNEDGVLDVAVPENAKESSNSIFGYNHPYLIIEKDGRITAVSLYSDYYGIYGDEMDSTDEYWQYIYFDRPTYKPNDTIQFWGTMIPRYDFVSPVDNLSVVLEEWSSGYNNTIIEKQELSIEDGYFTGQIELVNVPVGYYYLTFRSGDDIVESRFLSIADYIKPSYEVTVTGDKVAAVIGEQVNFAVETKFFEGTTAPYIDMTYQDNYRENPGEITSDITGLASFSLTMDDEPCQTGDWSCWVDSNEIIVRPNIVEEGEVVGKTNVKVFPSKINIKQNHTDDEVNQDQSIVLSANIGLLNFDQMNSVNRWDYDEYLNEYPTANLGDYPIVITVTEEWWEKIETGEEYDFVSKKVVKTYDYEKKENVVWQGEVKTDANGDYQFKIDNPDPQMWYTMKVEARDDAGRYVYKDIYNSVLYAPLYYAGGHEFYYLSHDDNKDSYHLGEKVRAEMVDGMNKKILPEAFNNRFMFIHYQNGLQDYTLSNSPVHEFSFDNKHIPNVYVEGLYFDGRRINSTVTPLNFDVFRYDYNDSELDISIEADKENYEPGDTANINIDIKDKDGRPVATKGNISLVDEAYYNLFDQSVNPLSSLYHDVDDGILFRGDTHESYLKTYFQAGGCFTGDTLILMADNTRKPIKDIKTGDLIMTFADSITREMVADEVIGTHSKFVGGYLIINNAMRVTPEHQIFLNGEWQPAGEARIGDWLKNKSGEPARIDSIEKIYEPVMVYNFTTANTHTYIANDFYVHNNKGGDTRDSFEDAAYFAEWQSNNNGQASINIQLPDNLTSWRMITQAIDTEQRVGLDVSNLIVKLPIRAEMVVGSTYLIDDKPIVSMRVFGEGLGTDDDVEAQVNCDSLGINKTLTIKPYNTFDIPLENLSLGEHQITLDVKSGELHDSLTRKFTVVESYVTQKQSRLVDVSAGEVVAADENATRTQVQFMNKDVGRFYGILYDLQWNDSARIDGIIAKDLANGLLRDYFGENLPVNEIDTMPYQQEDGGISLLPYSDSDVKISALVAGSQANEKFNVINLKNYFGSIISNKESNTSEIAVALAGLAGLGEPVLNQVNLLYENPELSVIDRLYLAYAMEQMGAGELAKSILKDIVNNNGQSEISTEVVLDIGSENENLEATKMAAIIAMATNYPDRELLFNFINAHSTDEHVMWLEKVVYIEAAKEKGVNIESQFNVKWAGKSEDIKLRGAEKFGIYLSTGQATKIDVNVKSGEVVAVIIEDLPYSADDFISSDKISINRQYMAFGPDDDIDEGDIVQVQISPVFSEAPDGFYTIEDVLPSGLKLLSRSAPQNLDQPCWLYPAVGEGQKVTIQVDRRWNRQYCGDYYISYYARVSNKGEYVVEPIMMYFGSDPTIKTISPASDPLVID